MSSGSSEIAVADAAGTAGAARSAAGTTLWVILAVSFRHQLNDMMRSLLQPAVGLVADLERLAGDAEPRRRLGRAGRERAMTGFTTGPIVDRIEKVLAETAALRPGWTISP